MPKLTPHVFISATSDDLGDLRPVVERQLAKGGIFGQPQENFVGDHRELRAFLRHKIDICDAVICLVGDAYGSAPDQPGVEVPRSYTQMEYDTAKELGKPVFVFFTAAGCADIKSVQEDPISRDLQTQHRKAIQKTNIKWQEFSSKGDLKHRISETIPTLMELLTEIETSNEEIQQTFPTPLARKFRTEIEKGSFASMKRLFDETVRFVALVSLQDSLFNRQLERAAGITEALLNRLSGVMRTPDWLELLRLSSHEGTGELSGKVVFHLTGWERRHHSRCKDIIELMDEAKELDQTDDEELVDKLKDEIHWFYQQIAFLKYYGLVQVIPGTDGSPQAQLLRGEAPDLIDLGDAPPSALADNTEQLYFVHPNPRRALPLFPAFAVLPREDEGGEVAGIIGVTTEDDRIRKITLGGFGDRKHRLAFRVDDRAAFGLETAIADELHRWLFPNATRKLGTSHQTGSAAGTVSAEDRFPEAFWEELQTATMQPGAVGMIGNRFRPQACLASGESVDLYLATDEQKAVSPPLVVHVMKKDVAQQPVAREWFEQRLACWRELAVPNVLGPHRSSDPHSQHPAPFTVVNYVRDARNLEQLLLDGHDLSEQRIVEILKIAAGVCRLAHEKGIRLVALPLRHFLIDPSGRLQMTGFDTAYGVNRDGVGIAPPATNYWRRFSKDWNQLAPELRENRSQLDPTIDIFALGTLLSALRRQPVVAMDHPPDPRQASPLDVVQFHCLAHNPDLRFRSVEHLLMLLDDFLAVDQAVIPPTIELGDDTDFRPQKVLAKGSPASGLRIGKYPVTNLQYAQFSTTTEHRSPYRGERYIPISGRIEFVRKASPRLAAPWCPVVGVDLADAEAYCYWLSQETGMRWRLPTEEEWKLAATLGKVQRYPWGDESPCAAKANHGNQFHGPTAVGGFMRGRGTCGCHDLAGNVWEWCSDFAAAGTPFRVLKGGSWEDNERSLGVAARRAVLCGYLAADTGFRVICEERADNGRIV